MHAKRSRMMRRAPEVKILATFCARFPIWTPGSAGGTR